MDLVKNASEVNPQETARLLGVDALIGCQSDGRHPHETFNIGKDINMTDLLNFSNVLDTANSTLNPDGGTTMSDVHEVVPDVNDVIDETLNNKGGAEMFDVHDTANETLNNDGVAVMSDVLEVIDETLNSEKGAMDMDVTESSDNGKWVCPNVEESISTWQKFPIKSFPRVLREFCQAIARSTNTDPAYSATFLLPVVASAVGSHIILKPKSDWSVPAILWAMVVADSGSGKTPTWKLAVEPLMQEQMELNEWNERALQEHGKNALQKFCIIEDTTSAAFIPILADNPDGVCGIHNETSGWLGALGSYGGSGMSEALYNNIYDGCYVQVNRKTGKRLIAAKHTHCSISGGIQPNSLKMCLERNTQFLYSGFLARFLLCMPPDTPRHFSDESVPADVKEAYGRMIDTLFYWRGKVDATPDTPFAVNLTPEARELFINYHDSVADERSSLPSGAMRAALAKLSGYALRIALTLHVADYAAGCPEGWIPPCIPDIEAGTMEAAITLTKWYHRESKRILQMLRTDMVVEGDREEVAIMRHVHNSGGRTDARKVAQNLSVFSGAGGVDRAKRKLELMVRDGRLTFEVQERKKGEPAKIYLLPNSIDAVPATAEKVVGGVGVVGDKTKKSWPDAVPVQSAT